MHHRLTLVTTLAILALAGSSPALHAQYYVHTYTDGEDNTATIDLATNGNRADLYVNGTNSATQSGDITGTGSWYKFGTGTLTLTGTLDSSIHPLAWAGTLVLGADQNAPFLYIYQDLTALDLGSHTFSTSVLRSYSKITGTTGALNLSGTDNYFYKGTIDANVTGSGSVKFDGQNVNTIYVTGNLSHTGGTQIVGGTQVNLGNGTSRGSISGAIDLVGTLTLNRTDDFTLDNDLSGTGGSLQKVGTNTVTLTGNNTMVGTVGVYNGTLKLGVDMTSFTGGFYVSTGTLDLQDHAINATALHVWYGGDLAATTGTFTVANETTFEYTGNNTVSAVLAGAGKLTLSSNLVGTVTLEKANTYTGVTTVNAGKLLVNGSTSASSVVTVNSGGTLGGSGTIGGNTTIASGGSLAPGNSPGLLTFGGDLTLNSGSTSNFQIDGTARGTTYDAVNVAGLTTLGGTLALDFSATIADGTLLNLFGGAGELTGDFSYITATGAYTGSFTNDNGYWTLVDGGQTLAFSSLSGNLGIGVNAVPEPSTYAAFAGLAALGLVVLRRRRAA